MQAQSEVRKQRLATALRQNLKRRKAAASGSKTPSDGATGFVAEDQRREAAVAGTDKSKDPA